MDSKKSIKINKSNDDVENSEDEYSIAEDGLPVESMELDDNCSKTSKLE